MVVIGTGGVGANVLQVCKAFGASKIIAVDIDDEKLEMAKAMGATHTINSKTASKSVPECVTDIVGKAKGTRFKTSKIINTYSLMWNSFL